MTAARRQRRPADLDHLGVHVQGRAPPDVPARSTVTDSVTLCPAGRVPESALSSSRPDDEAADQDSAAPSAVIVISPSEAVPSWRSPGDTSRLPCSGGAADEVGWGTGCDPPRGGRPRGPLALALESGWVSLTNSCSPGVAVPPGEGLMAAVGDAMGAAASAPACRGRDGPAACVAGSRPGL